MHLHVPPPHHNYHDQDSGLTEISYGCAMPVRILMTRSRYKILERVGGPEVLVWTVLERVGCQMACCAVVTAHETLRTRKLPWTTRAMLLPSFGPALPSGHHRRSSCRHPQLCETTRRRLLARLRGSNGCALPQCHMKYTRPGRSVPRGSQTVALMMRCARHLPATCLNKTPVWCHQLPYGWPDQIVTRSRALSVSSRSQPSMPRPTPTFRRTG